jgi:hypothetical protein
MLNQAKTVILITKRTLGERYNPSVPVKALMTPVDKSSIVNGVIEMFRDGQTGFVSNKETNQKRMTDEKALREYVVGLCNNHWRKHKELNGGVKFIPSYTKESKQAA